METITHERLPNKETLELECLLQRETGDYYFVGQENKEQFIKFQTDSPATLDELSQASALVDYVRNGDSYGWTAINPAAYDEAFAAITEIAEGKAEWDHVEKESGMFSFNPDFGFGAGLSLGLNLKLQYVKSYSFISKRGVLMPEKGMMPTEIYDDVTYLENYGYGDLKKSILESKTMAYIKETFNKVVTEIIENAEKVAAAGVETVVTNRHSILSFLLSNTSLKEYHLNLSTLAPLKRSYRIRTTDADAATASSIGDVAIVNIKDETGALLPEFPAMDLTLMYQDEWLTSAGFSISDADKLRIYRWSGESGFYDYTGGSVDVANKSVTASITLPGQYILGIDLLAPLVLDFQTSDQTPTPAITFSVNDNLSGVDATQILITLDDVEIVNNSNYMDYFDIESGSFYFPVQTPLETGEHHVAITLADTAGNTESHHHSFSVNDSAPVISHSPQVQTTADAPLDIRASVTDDESVESVWLYYRAKTGEMDYRIQRMITSSSSSEYLGTIPEAYLTSSGVRYYIKARDVSGNEIVSSPADISVADQEGPEIAFVRIEKLTDGYLVRWDSDHADIEGFNIYVGESPGAMTLFQDVGNVTWMELDETHQPHYVAISGYDDVGNEGPMSQSIALTCSQGDANGNGWIDLADVIYTLQVLTGISNAHSVYDSCVCGDADGSGKADLKDVVYMIQLVGINKK